MAFRTNCFRSNDTVVVDQTSSRSKNLVARTFLYLFFGLLITSIVAVGVATFYSVWATKIEAGSGDYTTWSNSLYVLIACSGLTVLFLSIFMHIRMCRNRRSLIGPSLIYVIAFGILLSTIIMTVDMVILLGALGITTLAFGFMAMIGFASKGRMKALSICCIGLMFAIAMIGIAALILTLCGSSAAIAAYAGYSALFFLYIIFVTIFDFARLGAISDTGTNSTNLALYCATQLFTDYIYIFVRIVSILSRTRSRN